MAKKEHLKSATPLPGGGLQWSWKGQGAVTHIVSWHGNGATYWTVLHDGVALRTENPWFLVKSRGEAQENIRHFRAGNLDKIHANRALLATGHTPDQHQETPYCNCGRCTTVPTV